MPVYTVLWEKGTKHDLKAIGRAAGFSFTYSQLAIDPVIKLLN